MYGLIRDLFHYMFSTVCFISGRMSLWLWFGKYDENIDLCFEIRYKESQTKKKASYAGYPLWTEVLNPYFFKERRLKCTAYRWGEWSASRSGRFTLLEFPCFHLTWSWVDTIISLHATEKEQISCLTTEKMSLIGLLQRWIKVDNNPDTFRCNEHL